MARGKGRPHRKLYEFTDSQVRWLIEQMERMVGQYEFQEDRIRAREIVDRLTINPALDEFGRITQTDRAVVS